MSAHTPVRLGLIGAGLFARDAHVPAINALGDAITITAICSRSSASAERLAQSIDYPVATTTSVDDLLARDDIDAVDLVLPIPLIPEVIHKALDAGKHIISEKPAAPDIASGRALLAHYAQTPDLVWMVGENYRYEPDLLTVAEILRSGEIGRPFTVHINHHSSMSADNQYYHTAWRHEEKFPGGFVMDGGVHLVALLRLALGEISAVSAIACQMRNDLPRYDTLSAALEFAEGFVGSANITYAAPSPWTQLLHIIGEKGALLLENETIRVQTESGERTVQRKQRAGVNLEFAAFVAAIREGAAHRNSPQEGLQDVAVIEALLDSVRTGSRVEVAKLV